MVAATAWRSGRPLHTDETCSERGTRKNMANCSDDENTLNFVLA
jgi:hypothetical protein